MIPRRSGYVLLCVIYLGFVSLGLPDGTFGVAWPGIAAELHLAIGLAGVLTIITTLLSGLSGFSSGAIVRRFRTGPVVMASCLLTGGALLMMARAPHFAWLVLAAIPLGLGAGAVDAALNGYVARHYSGRHMNWLHGCWGIGATCGPVVMGQALATGQGWRAGYLVLGAVQLALAGLFLVSLRLWSAVPERTHAASLESEANQVRPTLGASSFAGWLSPALFALYAALESAIGLWSASILVLDRGFAPATAAVCTAAYYGAIMAGRFLIGFVVERGGNRRMIGWGVALALLGAGVFAFAADPWLAALALAVAGLGLAPVYPGLMHEAPRRFAPDAAQTVIGRQTGGAYLGMATLPAVLGWLAEHSLASIPFVVLAGIGLLMVGIRRLDRLT